MVPICVHSLLAVAVVVTVAVVGKVDVDVVLAVNFVDMPAARFNRMETAFFLRLVKVHGVL